MDLMNKVLKNKSLRKFLYLILFFIGVFNFPYLGFLFLVFLVIALMFDSGGKDAFKQDLPEKKKNEKDNSKRLKVDNPQLQQIIDDLESDDISRIKGVSERIPSILEDIQTPKTFYEIIGDLTIKTQLYYSKGLYKSDQIDEEYAFLIDDFKKAKKICDNFFDGNESVKNWVIYRTLEKEAVTEKGIYDIFPDLIEKIQDIRTKKWEDIAWFYFIADKVEEVSGKDSCNKERFDELQEIYAPRDAKQKYIESLSEEFRKEYKLLIKIDLQKEKVKQQKITDDFLRSIDVNTFKGKPKKIKSEFKWELDDAIKFARIIQNNYSNVSKFNAFGDIDELTQKKLQYAGLVRSKDLYKAIYDKDFIEQIQDIERVSDFYQYEMFDEDPIQTSIDNEDIERIMFYSLIQIPKKVISQIEQVSIDDPEKRAPYFSIMYAHMRIILMVLQDLKVYNSKEIAIDTWIFNQITDPLDKGKAMLSFGKKNKKGNGYDKRFVREIWVPLYRLLELELGNPKGLTTEVEKVIQIIESVFISSLYNYFVGDPEQGYEMMKPMFDAMKEQEKQ